MPISPKNLNIPLERNDRPRLVRATVAACILIAAALGLTHSPFALAFSVACIVGLPFLLFLLLLRSSIHSNRFLITLASLMAYIALAKYVLVPFLVKWIQPLLA